MNVTRADRRLLEAIVLDRSAPQKPVWRANIILATADGCGTAEIMRRSGKSKPVVWRWQARFMAEGVEGRRATRRARPANHRCRPTPCRRLSTWRSDRHREKKPTGPVECWRKRRE